MSRITEIRENWKVKEQGCGKEFISSDSCTQEIERVCGFINRAKNKDLCPTCKATLKATYEENLKEAESMLVFFKERHEFQHKYLSCSCDTPKKCMEAEDKWVCSIGFKLKEWQKLRDEIKLKLEELK